MTEVGLRERKKEKTREALAASALRQFADRGFDRVTVEEIAAACDVSPRTFFRYFASKEDVLFADSDVHRVHLLQLLATPEPDGSPFEALEAAMRSVAEDYTTQFEIVRARHHIVNATPSLRTRVAERQQGWESDVVDQLRASHGTRARNDFELRLMVAAATTALRVAVEAWVASDGKTNINRLLDDAFRYLRQGFEPSD